MAYGVTETGFIRKPLSVIKAELEALFKASFGDINTEADSVFGQMIGILSEQFDLQWQMAEHVYLSQYPASAFGVSLDNVASLTGLTRLGALPSTCFTYMIGDAATVIPAGTLIKQSTFDVDFSTDEEVTIEDSNLNYVVLSFTQADATSYEFTVNAISVEYTSAGSGDLIADIINGLTSAIDTAFPDSEFFYEVFEDTNLILYSDSDYPMDFAVVTGSVISIEEKGTGANVSAVETGPNTVPIESIDTIVTPVSGLDSVLNKIQGTIGRNLETDTDFRVRRKRSLQIAGAGTIPSMQARLLQEITGVTTVSIYENPLDVTDGEGRPPHSFEVIIQGGDDQDIIDKIWEIKPAGIQTYGNTSGTALDSEGGSHTLYFSRPVNQYLHINIEFTLNPEEIFPTNGISTMKEALVEYISGLEPGEDLIPQRYLGILYNAVEGIKDVTTLEHDLTNLPGDSPTYVTTSITVSDSQISIADVSRITIVQV